MVTFIAPAFNEDPYAFIGSLRAQTNTKWKAIIYHNGRNPHLEEIVHDMWDPRITYRESPENTGFWGCYNRKKALEEVSTPYVIQTSIQDYWLPCTVEDLYLAPKEDIIYWDSINHLTGPERLDCELSPGRVDWGNFAIRTELAQRVGINYPEEFMADWLFVQDVLAMKPTTTKINKILTIHN